MPIILPAMTRWSVRQALVLLLAVFVTLSMSLSAIHASGMMPAMAKMTIAGGSGHDGCEECADSGASGAKVIACGSVCVAPAIAMLPQDFSAAFAQASPTVVKRCSLLHGRTPAPDPYPPKPADLG